jgi:hypothetical protein
VTVDVHGQVVAEESPASEAEWLRKNVLAQALPNGTCTLLAAQQECLHANACLTCAFFRTNASYLPQHKQQLVATQSIVRVAREKGWTRQAEMNPGGDERAGGGQPAGHHHVAGRPCRGAGIHSDLGNRSPPIPRHGSSQL